MSMTTAYWCLGSNLDAEKHIAQALKQFQSDFSEITVSAVYRSAAVGFAGDDFLNVVLATKTALAPLALLDYAAQLEETAGRVRLERGRFDSRTLDVDLLMCGSLAGFHHGRDWPAADIADYAHVLKPLAEIAAEVMHPVLGLSFSQLWKEFDQSKSRLTIVENVL